MKKIIRRAVCCLTALLCAVALVTADLPAAMAVSQADINALKSEARDLESKKRTLSSQLKKLAGDKAQVIARRELLDQQIQVTEGEIHNVEEQIESYTALITQTEEELAEAEEKEQIQYELFCKRVRLMEKRGKVNYWAWLFRSDSFTDLISRLDIINEIMDADQRIIDELKALQEEIKEKKAALEGQRAGCEQAKGELVSKKNTLDAQRAEANRLVKEIERNAAAYSQTLAQLDQEEERIQARIVALSKQLAQQQHHDHGSNRPVPPAKGGYSWPVPSRRVTSPYGRRPSPGGIGSRYHKGVDIGGVGYSTTVRAAKAGTVIVSQYSSSYGEYVVVAHGSGNTTLYAHMSRRLVRAGQYVKQGDALGITGSTGHSTGPHLHFEITENGKRTDPLKYLTGYIRAW